MTTKITIVFRHRGLHQPLMTPQSHCNNERSQFSASVPPIETSQFLFPTHFVADVRFFTPSDPWIRSMDLTHGSDPWIRSMDQNQIHGSEQKAGQNRLPYLVLDGNYHMFLLATKTSFGRYVCLESAPILRPWLNLAIVSPAQSVGWRRLFGCYFRPESL